VQILGGGLTTYYATIYLKPSQVASFTTYFNDEEYGKLIQEAKNRKKSVPALVAETVREAMP